MTLQRLTSRLILLALSGVAAAGSAEVKESEITKMRKEIFGQSKWQEPGCAVVSQGLKDELEAVNGSLHEFVKSVLENHASANLSELKKQFHPRLKMTAKKLKPSFQSIELTYGKPANFTIYRVWALNTVDGNPDLLPCHADQLAIGPHYGYPLHFGIWIQVMGKKELGRIYTSVVPAPKVGWRLGAWHLQQWTHQEKDPQKWVEEALEDHEKGSSFAAYLKLDLAAKLLNGGGYIFPVFLEDVKVTQKSYLKDKSLQDVVQSALGSAQKVAYTSSIFARDGAGLLLRMEVPKNSTVAQTKSWCNSAAARLYRKSAEDDVELGGLKCSFVKPAESKDRDGRLGSRFLTGATARKLATSSEGETSGPADKKDEPEEKKLSKTKTKPK